MCFPATMFGAVATRTYTASVSDSTNVTPPDEPVKLTKTPSAANTVNAKTSAKANTKANTRFGSTNARATRPRPPTVPDLPLPLTVKLAFGALGVMALAGLARAVAARGSTAQFTYLLNQSNKNAKKPKNPYTAADVAHDLHNLRSSVLLQAVVIAVAVAFLIFALRKVRSAGPSRWAVLVVMLFTQSPLYVRPLKNWPAAASALGVILGVASILAIVFLFVPQSTAYFRACKQALHPDGVPPSRGLAGMFGQRTTPAPRPAANRRGAAATNRGTAASASATETTSTVRSKAKVRSDEAAVAKGADLARNRAKASKSRRTEV